MVAPWLLYTIKMHQSSLLVPLSKKLGKQQFTLFDPLEKYSPTD
jgi:hypothetical protein